MDFNGVLMIESCEKKSVADDYSNTSIVHVRNSKIFERELGYKLITHMSQIPDVVNLKWKHIVCHYASPYMKYKAYMDILDNNFDAKMWWNQNDHDNEDNILLRNYVKKYHKKYHVICNNPRSGYRHWILGKNLEEKKLNDWIDEWHTVNLNALIFEEIANAIKPNKDGCIYFGTFRKHRAKDMAAFNGIQNYTISSSAKNEKKFTEAGIEAKFIDKLDWTRGAEQLRQYKYSIYFEDIHTHDNFAFLANRYYECLMCDVLMFFDKKCAKTIDEARKMKYTIPDYLIVDDSEDLNKKMNVLNSNNELYLNLLDLQSANKFIAKIERSNVLKQIKQILS